MTRRYAACLVAILWANQFASADLVLWEASSGLFPDEITPPYTLTNDADTEVPTLGDGVLTLSTDPAFDVMYYTATPTFTDSLVIKTEMRLVSGDTTEGSRAPAAIFFRLDFEQSTAMEASALLIQPNGIGLLSGETSLGPFETVDTTSDFHTYEIHVRDSGTVQVYYDDVLTLTGTTYTAASADQVIHFGDWTRNALGTSEWRSVSYRPIPEPSSFLFFGLISTGMVGRWSWKKLRCRDVN